MRMNDLQSTEFCEFSQLFLSSLLPFVGSLVTAWSLRFRPPASSWDTRRISNSPAV